jgi:6-pyruvoyltetrahydropterin/6-carboxytetrahydropterin synthase
VFKATVEITFSAAHQIREHAGKCARLHGHNYRVAVTVAGDHLNHLDMLLDFGELKRICAEVADELDHSCLNELPAFAEANPTAEAIARYIHGRLSVRLAVDPDRPLRVAEVTVWESDRSSATYQE